MVGKKRGRGRGRPVVGASLILSSVCGWVCVKGPGVGNKIPSTNHLHFAFNAVCLIYSQSAIIFSLGLQP